MALGRRLVVYGRSARQGPELDVLLRARDFQVYAVETEEDLRDALEFSQPDAAVISGPHDSASLARLVASSQRRGRSLIVVVWPNAPVAEAVELLESGADYVSNTFQPDWLAAQIRAMLRRFGAERMPASVMELGYLKIDLHQRQVTVNGREVGLTRTEFDVLRVLGERPGTVLPSGEIMQHVMGVKIPESQAQDLLKVHIHRLRQKLEKDLENPRFIRSVRGQGYMYAFERRSKDRAPVVAETH